MPPAVGTRVPVSVCVCVRVRGLAVALAVSAVAVTGVVWCPDAAGGAAGAVASERVRVSDVGAAVRREPQFVGVAQREAVVPGPRRGDQHGTRHAAPDPTAPDPTAPDPTFWVDPDSRAAQQAAEWRRTGRDADAQLMDRIATRPQAEWLFDPGPRELVQARTSAAAREGRTAVLVAYYIPQRDCGSYSGGGAESAADYREWADEFAAGLGDRGAYVIVEPDAVAQAVSGCDRIVAKDRYALLAYAVDRFKRQPGTRVYLDAGNSAWIPDTSRLVEPLKQSGIAGADGFALNVSNFQTDAASSAYGTRLSEALDGKHFVIDSSRNGNGPYVPDGGDDSDGDDGGDDDDDGDDGDWDDADDDGDGVADDAGIMDDESWCNPPGRALGTPPTVQTGVPLLDAYLWIKRPGESDGTCRGGPDAGQWWPSYALELARNARG
ncbi:glycoside hydrolase family 6 protein [Streptomyces albicerus]|uniref:glycoside hydrolase family 6 protein n=1 Tax=Streptomyces albicerus TaxID=2569859 RepID=UPI001CED1FF5|nr:glycoside hydrolase family 6 protein [Streptomyces albicerus]